MSEAGNAPRFRYEFRVWGQREEVAKRLSVLAESEQRHRLEDRYLLVGDTACNIKIRENRLKVKRLINVRSGFQWWSSVWLRDAPGGAQSLERVLDGLGPDQRLPRSDQRVLARAIGGLQRSDRIRAVTVTKRRRRFRLGSVKAESSIVRIAGRPDRLRTVAIEGRNLDDLVHLRSSLGLGHLPNLALHLAVDLTDGGPGSPVGGFVK